MDYNNFREKIYYINLKDIFVYIFLAVSIYLVFIGISLFNKNVAYDLLKIFELIISIILLTLSIYIKNITKKEIYGLINFFLLINFSLILVFLSPNGEFISFKRLLDYVIYDGNYDFRYINIVIFFFMITKYRMKECSRKIVHLEYLFLFFLSAAEIYIFNIYPSWQLYLLNILFILVLIILTYRNIYIFNFNSNGKIDLLKFSLLFETIRFIFMIVSKILMIPVINSISIMIMQIALLTSIFAIISNITKEIYNYIFKETIMTSKYLEDINRKIIKNNYKLEYTYKKLNDKQMLYKSFLGSLPNPIVIINNKFRISYCNVKFLNEVGKTNIREVVNRRIDNYIEFSKEFSKEICFDRNSVPYTTNIELNGKKIEIRFFNSNNQDTECILIFKDLTEKIKLSDMKEELQEISIREEIKKNFLANISHDLKIPVNVIYSAIQLEKILLVNNDIQKIKSYNEISKENCLILTKFTNNLIDISKIDSENLETNLSLDNIVEFIEDYLFSLSLYIKNSGLDIIFDTNEEEIYIYFDKEMMQRVILNLISNSIKFTHEGGVIFVKIEDFSEYVLIELGDNGIGMSKKFISRAFNKYEMESRHKNSSATGFGVGLFVVFNLIKAQDGDIEIRSEIGKGTNFSIKLYKKRMF